MLTSKQLDRLSSIFEGAGQIIFGATIITPIVAFDKIRPEVLLYGGITVIILWATSLLIARIVKYEY